MEKHIEVMKQSLGLSETVLEGLQHIQKLLGEGKSEQTIFLVEDTLLAYEAISKAIDPAVTELKSEEITAKQADFSQAADLVVIAYEEKNYVKVQEILQFTLVPRFKRLKEQLEEVFKPYVIS